MIAQPPRATARLQIHAGFTLDDARAALPYLARFGISHVYASPILKARPGSMHGYDVTDHTRLNPELGTQEEFEATVATLHEHGMGLIVGAFVVAVIYMAICGRNARSVDEAFGPGKEGHS